ncbi:inverse autotransporter beta domain-containing protein [Xenorhabdus sp. DI]|uniref:inverse autotransporter beta domain-containing protein n=1 Tax=Xenorhabdus doucetiae TaxID=351671 RepID=UPI0019AECCD8|nr:MULTISPECIES: inverse autotransporter beta domain-containing protein [unclassified Xenorhabdus]MBD2785903.1 inverse autotransporter beta domain-containing protein [Xenorhabdus sp. 3]MBD2789560.1 inverse autotransporter beta domain-containing protein [Xenorhabdus sp. DI]
MSFCTRKLIVFFIFFYALLIPSIMINALAEGNVTTGKSYPHLQKNNDTSKSDTPYVFVKNIQTINHILSSSPSELAEQAKSYALGKFNGTVSSEMQKWLSQFGSARIHFGLDKKGTLKNNALDLLLPFYDNKADWLFFSQLGYRNKDSRNTVNVGLGGRYFYQNWMYGLNTFYDHDITGKNQRLGLGGEIWGDYIKLSTNAYYHLSGWQESQNFDDYYERAANGYDITGEFFLPTYPNLSAKLTYEQYLGDNVILFDPDTKQKNPSLATLGLAYTPIPLFTMGVNYKQGESGHTETQFLANLNYKFGIPLRSQLSPDNVSLMRTLAGSRYDLVERNNNIVLEHQKKEKAELIVLEPIIGYGHQEIMVNSPVQPNFDIKQIKWVITDKEFYNNNGKLSSESGNSITITLPSYQETHQHDYILNILPESIKGKPVKTIEVHIKVLPFMIDGQVNIIPPESPTATGKKENGYTFGAPVITYDGSPTGTFVKNARIDKVSWSTEPDLGEHSGLKFMWNNEPAKTNEKGELTDEKGQLKPNELVSTKPYNKVDVYIQLDGAPRQKMGSVKFSQDKSQYKIKDGKLNVTPDPKVAQVADGVQKYTYTANIITDDGLTVDEVDNVKWSAVGKNLEGKEVKNIPVDGPTGTIKTHEGKLTATLSSKIPLKDVVVTLSIENKASASAEPVSFVPDTYRINVTCKASGEIPVLVTESYTCTAKVTDAVGKEVTGKTIDWGGDNSNLEFTPLSGKTDNNGEVTATLTSHTDTPELVVTASVDGQSGKGESKEKINFVWPEITIERSPKDHDITVGSQEKYQLTATVWREKAKTVYKGQEIKFKWVKPQLEDGTDAPDTSLSPSTDIPQSVNPDDGTLKAEIESNKVQQVKACINIDGRNSVSAECSGLMKFVEPPVEFDIVSVEVTDFDKNKPLSGNGTSKYYYQALIVKKGTKDPVVNHKFEGVKWIHNYANPERIEAKKLPLPEAYSPTNDDPFKTDKDGFLYATLKSHVGVKNVKVTLTIPKPDHTIAEHDADNPVEFSPVPQPAVLYVYRQGHEKEANKTFDNTNGKDHPHTVFAALRGKLQDPKRGSFEKSDKVTYGVMNPSSPYGAGMLYFDAGNRGPIQFVAPGSATITATINKKSGEIQLYEYTMSASKIIQPVDTGYKKVTDQAGCLNHSGIEQDLFSDKEASNPADIYSLHNEFGNLYNWGVFDSYHNMDENKVTFIVKNTEIINGGNYRVYDSKNNKFDDYDEGVVLCYQF